MFHPCMSEIFSPFILRGTVNVISPVTVLLGGGFGVNPVGAERKLTLLRKS